MVQVIKASGEKQEFDRNKIIHTCIRAGVSEKDAEKVATYIEGKIHEGITTKKILHLVLKKLDTIQEHHALKYDLRTAVSNLTAESEFEKYVEHILKAHGYETKWNQIIQGEVIEHQIDVIAEKNGKKYLIECKHHVNPHRFCGLGTILQTWAVIDDIRKGPEKFDNLWLVTNTKFSEHAIRYADAKKLILTGWNWPRGNDLRDLIHKKGLWPITILSLNHLVREKFSEAGILLLKELVSLDLKDLYERTHIDKRILKDLIEKADKILK